MLKTTYFWNNETFADADELKDAIMDFVCDCKYGKIMAMMDEVGCDWNDTHDCEICRANAIEDLIAKIMQWQVRIKTEIITDSGKIIEPTFYPYEQIARRKIMRAIR